ncbi:MAG: SUMF1/EgtB/PvdO family nonheme iron enzyme [Planctomycetes bacterium]|nr:SUMF1/EgtB/PvdO family nonheme iron enzyme [Planctomycetota bacterium]
MNEGADNQEPFPDLDAAGALRAAFRTRDSSSGNAQRASTAARVEAHAERQGYELQGEIARGGMGIIVRAFDRALTRAVALKMLREELAHEPRFVHRFLEEARVTARLDHPGIVPVHEAGRDPSGRAYFAMRLVHGRDLRRIVELANANEEGWSRTRALSVFLKVCEAMAYAHDKGVLHRDLKPSNVMVGEFGEVYVMDWGLARVVGHADAHDLRLRDQSGATGESRARGAAEPGNVESPIVTMDGEVLGTPCYMSPEQAQGRMAELGARSDVYSVGAMLYHLLAGEMPYVPAGTSVDGRTVLTRLVQGPPRPLHELRANLPAELMAICERAMARDPRDRYPGMLDMADDLRAFLERRVVRAYETGAWAEAKKWVRRNNGLAASSAAAVLALLSGLVASLFLRAQSDRNAKLALDNAEVAQKNEADVLRLSALQKLDDLGADADRLWPAQQELVPAYTDWLARAQELVDELPGHEAKLAELRARCVPWTAEQEGARRAQHPRLGELKKAQRELAYLKRMQTVLTSVEAVQDPSREEAGGDVAGLPRTAAGLDALARPLIDPRRTDHGEEAKGLFLARRAVEFAGPLVPHERASIRDTLAWALFANGRFDEAMAEEERALEEAGAERAREFQRSLEQLQASIEEQISPENLEDEEQRVAELDARVAELEAEIAKRPELAFADMQDRWWYNQLEKLVDGSEAFSDPETGLFSSGVSPGHGWGVRKRLEFARTIVERSVSGPEAAARWSRALASIRDKSECPLYDGLAFLPQLGLLPIGRDPASGAWEFAHLQTGEPPQRGADGKLVLREETGLVFVLLPGDTFQMGAQRNDPNGPNFDPHALDHEGPVHEVTLAPFFLSKYEMTQAQWLRLTGKNPSVHDGTRNVEFWSKIHRVWSGLHPVEQVSWEDCNAELTRLRLAMPTEAQWEYACRAETSGPFSSGDAMESLQDVANLADSYGRFHGFDTWSTWETWLDDGETLHGEVGSYRANAFGLHDVHGNVFEWCKDPYGVYGKRVRPGDGESLGSGLNVVLRGGSFASPAVYARSAFRFVGVHDYANDNLGLRPARSLSP